MTALNLRENCLGLELHDGDRLVALYRAREELPAIESPKPCFAPIYTPSGDLITEYRPSDHAWHTGLYFGWVHANGSNLWGGPLYNEESGKYEMVPTHGRQRHDGFSRPPSAGEGVEVHEGLDWLAGSGGMLAREMRSYCFRKIEDVYLWTVETAITPATYPFVLGASRKSHYSGFELRMGPPFVGSGDPAEGALHRSSEGLAGHEATMGEVEALEVAGLRCWLADAGRADAGGRRAGAQVRLRHPRCRSRSRADGGAVPGVHCGLKQLGAGQLSVPFPAA